MLVKNVFTELAVHQEGSFIDLMPFNGRQVGACDITGISPVWEMHPDTDEFFYILDGEFEITLLQNEQPEHFVAEAGSVFIVPKGIWHKPAAPKGAKFVFYTPGTSLHSDAEDPRN